MQSTTQRPLGITILAVLAAIGGVLGLFGGIVSFAGYPISGVLGLLLAIAYLAFAYGAWTLQPWAWMIGIVVVGLAVILTIVNFFIYPGYGIISLILGLLVPGIILYYLMTPDVKKAFGQAA